MKLGVVRLSGDRCGGAVDSLAGELLPALGAAVRVFDRSATTVTDVDALILPGADDDARDARAPIVAAVARFAAAGGPVLGICGGFGLLCEAGLLDGALEPNEPPGAVATSVHCVVEGRPTPFSHAIPAGRHFALPVAGARGRFTHPDIDALEAQGRVVLRYCSADGEVAAAANPNGSLNNVAGICSGAGNVVGLVPHPERRCVGADAAAGRSLFECLLGWGNGRPARV